MTAEPPGGGFEQFYAAQFVRRVRWAVRKFRVSVQDAEDVVQDAMAELVPKWGTDKALDPGALLTTIIQRKVYKRWSQGSVAAVVPLEREFYQLEAVVADPAVTAEQRDTIRRAASIMDSMERQIVLGRARQDSALAIAAGEGVTADAVRSAGRRMERRMTAAIETEPALPGRGRMCMSMCLKMLPAQQRRVFKLAIDGYEPSAIAKILNITANNARVNLHHAMKAVARMLPPAPVDTPSFDLHLVGLQIEAARHHRADHGCDPANSAVDSPGNMPPWY